MLYINTDKLILWWTCDKNNQHKLSYIEHVIDVVKMETATFKINKINLPFKILTQQHGITYIAHWFAVTTHHLQIRIHITKALTFV